MPFRFRISDVYELRLKPQIRITAICGMKMAIFCFFERLKCQIHFEILLRIKAIKTITRIVKIIFKKRPRLIIDANPPASPDIARSSGKNGVFREAIFAVLMYRIMVASEYKTLSPIRQFRKIPTNKKLSKTVIIEL